MGRWSKVRARLLSGRHDRNVPFADLTGYLIHLGFEQRTRGDHFVFTREGVAEILNLQPADSASAKPYQVRQVRGIILRYRLGSDDDEI